MLAYCLTLLSFFNINLTHSPVLSNLLTLHLVTPFTFLFFHLTFLNMLFIYLEDFFVNQVFILNFKFLGCNWKMMKWRLGDDEKEILVIGYHTMVETAATCAALSKTAIIVIHLTTALQCNAMCILTLFTFYNSMENIMVQITDV